MLANTLTVTINSVAKVLTRVNQDSFSSEYRLSSATELLVLKIRNTTERSLGFPMERHNVDLSWTTHATLTEPEKFYSVSQTFKKRIGSFQDPTVLVQAVAGLATLVNAQATAIAGGES